MVGGEILCKTGWINILKNVFAEKELNKNSVVEEYSTTAKDGKKYKTKHYSLEAVISVGYRVNTSCGTQFRIWATDRVKQDKNYISDFDNVIKQLKGKKEDGISI